MSYEDPASLGQGQPPLAKQSDGQEDSTHTTGVPVSVRLPFSRPVVTYVLLALIVLVFAADVVLEKITGSPIIFILGAQVNSWVAAGEYWRLFTAIFLHGSLTHLAFNGWALFSLGQDIESFDSPRWFTAIYLVSGLAGNVAWYVFGTDAPSVGASGAIFGLIGAEVAYFVRNRRIFGAFARQRLGTLAILIGVNLLFGFTVPNINNFAHLGGLTAGFLLGLVLSPRYALTWSPPDGSEPKAPYAPTGRWVDGQSQVGRVLAILLASAILFGLVLVGNHRWAG
jgi:rhomboid protease GluP